MVAIMSLIVGGIGYLVNLFFDIGPMFQIPFSGRAFVDTDVAYNLLAGDSYLGKANVTITIQEIVSKSFGYKLFGLLNFSILITISILFLKNLAEFFGNLSEVKEWTEFFTRENYKNLKSLAVLYLIASVYQLIPNVLFSWFLVRDVSLLGSKLQFHPHSSNLWDFVSVFILFGVARIYKAAIEMKEESEYTI